MSHSPNEEDAENIESYIDQLEIMIELLSETIDVVSDSGIVAANANLRSVKQRIEYTLANYK